MNIRIFTLADRPDLLEPMWGMNDTWPAFMDEDPISSLFYNDDVVTLFGRFTLVGLDESGAVVAKAHSIPLHLPRTAPLPAGGWDAVVTQGITAHLRGRTPNTVSALEIAIAPHRQGDGLSTTMLAALRDNAFGMGFDELIAPLRPAGKTDVREPMASYAYRTRPDGLPIDHWLRVHVRAGGHIDSVAPRSMVIPGTLDEWRQWTGLPFDRSGPVEVPGALAPVLCDLDQDSAVYIEPNIWVRHMRRSTT